MLCTWQITYTVQGLYIENSLWLKTAFGCSCCFLLS